MQIKRKHCARWAILALALLAFLLAIAAPARADSFTWAGPNHQGGNGDFNTPNWDDGDGQLQGPPGPGDSAFIPSGAILSCSGGGVETLDTEASLGGGIDLTGGFSCTNLGSVLLSGSGNLTVGTIGPVSGDSAEDIFVMGASVTAGSAVSPNIDISAGGSLVVNSSVNKGEGSVSGAMSIFQVQGALLNFNGGASGGGEVEAQSIGSNNGLSGILSCDGAGSTLSVSGGGEFDGQGLEVTNGAQATIGGDLNFFPTPSPLVGGGGSANFDGAGTVVTVSGLVQASPNNLAGARGGGIEVSDGALLHAGKFLGDSGGPNLNVIDVSNSATLQVDSSFGLGNYSTATMTVESGSTVALTSGAVAIGVTAGGNGTLSMDASSLTVGGAPIYIGEDSGATGLISLADSSVMQAGGAGGTAESFLKVGNYGTGTLKLASGSSLKVVGANYPMEIGSQANSTGEVDIDAGCTMSVEGSLAVGNLGGGNLNVDGTASVAGNFYMGQGDAAAGFQAPTGFLNINAGGQFSAGSGGQSRIGLGAAGAITKLSASGAGAIVNLNGLVILGIEGEGKMYVSGGAAARIFAGELASAPGSFGSLTVYNSGSATTVSRFLDVGGPPGTPGGPGFVDVDDDGLLTIYSRLFISATGRVTVGPVALPDGTAATSGGRVFVGTDNFGPDGAVRVGNAGTLCGKGKQVGTAVLAQNVTGNVIIGAGGRFKPGGDPDVFSIQGDCDLSDGGAGGGTTEFEIAGAGTAGTDYDQLMVSGATTLGGTLRLVLLNGYTPKVGDTFNFIQSGSQTGTFAQIVSPSLTVSQTPSATGLSATITGITSTAAPAITSGTAPTAYVGTPFDFAVSASNDAAGFGATGLPDGLSIDAATGQIFGIPTTAGSYPVALTATNASGTGTGTLTLTVAPVLPVGVPTITSATSADAQTGVTFMYQIDASNAPTSYAATGLPPGLTLNTNAGLISGVPTQTGTFLVALSATNASGAGTATLTLTVTTPLPAATLSVTTPTVTAGSGGTAAFKVTLSTAPTAPLTVKYSIKGTATNGVDYELLTGKLKFKVGKTSKPIRIVPLGDLGGASKKTVKIALVARPGYTVGSTAPLKVKILAP